MSAFQIHLMALIALWLLAVAVRFRRSTVVLAGGLIAVGLACGRGLESQPPADHNLEAIPHAIALWLRNNLWSPEGGN